MIMILKVVNLCKLIKKNLKLNKNCQTVKSIKNKKKLTMKILVKAFQLFNLKKVISQNEEYMIMEKIKMKCMGYKM
jgi:hypothetical protein